MTPTQGAKIFYGWYIVALVFFGRFMATGVGFYIFNAFMKPLCEDRGWTRAQLNLAPIIGQVVGLAATFLFGTIVDRVGPRRLMTMGPIISGVAFMCLGQVREIWQFYLFNTLLFFGNSAMAGIVANTAVNKWFVKKRGRAMGLSMVGISFAGAIIPYFAMMIVDWSDLDSAFIYIGAIILTVSPLAWAVIRNKPEEYGMEPDGVDDGTEIIIPEKIPLVDDPATGGIETSGPSGAVEPGPHFWTFSMVVRSTTFWKLGIAYAMAMMGVVGVMFQLAPRFEDIGFDRQMAVIMMSATALLGAFGKYFWGMLCDRFDPRRVAAVLMVSTGVGLGLGLFQNSFPALLLFILVFGFAMGGVVTTSPIMTAFLFGREAFASVARFMGLLVRMQLMGYLVMGLSFDRTGSYDTAYAIFIALNFVAAVIILSIKKPQNPNSI